MTTRRQIIAGLGAAAAWPMVARGQQALPLRRIGVLFGSLKGTVSDLWDRALQQGLADLGWVAGRNLQIDYRFAGGDRDLAEQYGHELLALRPEVIVATPITDAMILENITADVPIVFVIGVDPVGRNYVESLARPGRNLTGFSSYEPAMSGKWLETLKEVAPNLSRVLVLSSGDAYRLTPVLRPWLETAAQRLGVALTVSEPRRDEEIGRAFEAFSSAPNGGVMILPSPYLSANRALILSLAARHRLPALYPFRYWVNAGGLMSYGIDEVDIFRRSASYVDRILRGSKPEDLPVQEPTKFELVVNLRTAKTLGLTIPEAFLLRADEVIE